MQTLLSSSTNIKQEAQLLQRPRAAFAASCHWIFRQVTRGDRKSFEITPLCMARVGLSVKVLDAHQYFRCLI